MGQFAGTRKKGSYCGKDAVKRGAALSCNVKGRNDGFFL